MRIQRILTNNALVVQDREHQEKIVCGKGIGFKSAWEMTWIQLWLKKPIPWRLTVKVRGQMERLLAELPLKYVELSDRIVQMARITLGQKLCDSLVISLADHLYYTLQRFRKGIPIANSLT